MPFQVGIGSLGGTVFFFQVGLFTPLQTMRKNCGFALIQYTKNQVIDQNTHVQSDCWFL